MVAKSPLSPRKRPRQRRSQQTVDAILEAAARVFAERGHAGGTTNHIAATAGVSVGSLYEYFPNKDAILVALVERQMDEMAAGVLAHLRAERTGQDGARPLIRHFVVAMLEAHERETDLYHVVFSEAPHPAELHACVLQMEETLAHALEAQLLQCQELSLNDSDTPAHLVVQTTEALTHRFVHHGIHDLTRTAFVDEVVTLLCGYLRTASARS